MEWKTVKLGKVCDLIKNREKGVLIDKSNYVSTENMLPNKGGVVPSSITPYDGAIIYHPKDVLISNIRPYFKKIWFADKIGGCSGDVLCFRSNSKIDSTYLYYLLSQDSFFDYVMAGSKGTKMPRGDKGQIMQYEFSLPPLDTQRRIAAILSSLDDKIENNNRINRNLEAQAQALFKSWFVDFEPFGGVLPEDWEEGHAEEFFTINIGKTPPRKEKEWFTHDNRNCKWVSISDMATCGTFISDSSEYLTQKAVDKFNIVMVPKDSILLSFKLTIGRVAIAQTELTTNEAIARFILPKPIYREYLYLLLKKYNYSQLGSTSSIATAVNSRIIKSMSIYMPNDDILREFSFLIKPLFDQIASNQRENSRLAALRDTLLPKLMKGEIEV